MGVLGGLSGIFFGLRRVVDLIREIEEYHHWVAIHVLNPDNRVNGNQSELELIPRLDLENIGRRMQPSGKRQRKQYLIVWTAGKTLFGPTHFPVGFSCVVESKATANSLDRRFVLSGDESNGLPGGHDGLLEFSHVCKGD